MKPDIKCFTLTIGYDDWDGGRFGLGRRGEAGDIGIMGRE